VRICLEVQGIGVLGYMYRGFSSVIAPSFGVPFGEDRTCISCGQCVSACPVGALTEKARGRKTVPLLERVEEGSCSLCSIGCGIEYRWHGSLLTRITERSGPPNNGKLCRKGKFGHDFLNDPVPAALGAAGLAAVSAETRKLLAGAKAPLMRISPLLCGEAIDAFLDAAGKKGIPVSSPGLSELDPRWAGFGASQPGASGHTGIRVMVGDIEDSNNVAFTEAYRLRREGVADLWLVAPGQANPETAARVASRVFPALNDLAKAIDEAAAKAAVIVVVNPQETRSKSSADAEKKLLDVLVAARDAGKARIVLLWNARNAGYLFGRLAAAGATGAKKLPAKPDLLLDAGIEEPTNGVKRVVWGRKAAEGAAAFIPLPVNLWTGGRFHPTGRESFAAGPASSEALAAAIVL
jgi:ferredoxin